MRANHTVLISAYRRPPLEQVHVLGLEAMTQVINGKAKTRRDHQRRTDWERTTSACLHSRPYIVADRAALEYDHDVWPRIAQIHVCG